MSLPESRLFNSVMPVAAAALQATRRVTVRIGVANPVFRHPVLLALEAATLADIGRAGCDMGWAQPSGRSGASEWIRPAGVR